jgi:hypothetical protein
MCLQRPAESLTCEAWSTLNGQCLALFMNISVYRATKKYPARDILHNTQSEIAET